MAPWLGFTPPSGCPPAVSIISGVQCPGRKGGASHSMASAETGGRPATALRTVARRSCARRPTASPPSCGRHGSPRSATTFSTVPEKEAFRSCPLLPRNAAHGPAKPIPSGCLSVSCSHSLAKRASRTLSGRRTSTHIPGSCFSSGTSSSTGSADAGGRLPAGSETPGAGDPERGVGPGASEGTSRRRAKVMVTARKRPRPAVTARSGSSSSRRIAASAAASTPM